MKKNTLKPDKILNYSCKQTNFGAVTGITQYEGPSIYYDAQFFDRT